MFNHWFEDDIDCKRENDIHRPKVYIRTTDEYIIGGANCAVCGKLLVQTTKYRAVSEEVVKSFVNEYTPNYCPNCGARLKAE